MPSDTRFKPGHKPAPPTRRFKKSVAAADLPTITQLAARGVREIDLARSLGLSQHSWERIKRDDPAVMEAFAAGRQQMHDALVGKLFEQALKGQLVPTLFLLKTVFHYREDAPPEMPHIVINLPHAAPATNYLPAPKLERVPEDDA